MNFFQRVSNATKAAAQATTATLSEAIAFVMTGGKSGGFGRAPRAGNGRLPGSNRDWEKEAGNVWDNSAVSLLLRWFCNTFCEAPLIVKRAKNDGTFEEQPMHELAIRVKRPNPHFTRTQLLKATLLSYFCDGNAYWWKRRSKAGKVVELWWLPHWMVTPRWSDDPEEWLEGGDRFLSYYEYKVDGKVARIAPADLVHFKEGVDPANYRRGLSPLKALLREICTDNQILTYTYGLLKNHAVPSVVLSPADKDVDVPDDTAKDVKENWRKMNSGDNANDVMVMTVPWKVERMGFSPSDMAVGEIGEIGEARLAGAFNLPPITVGLIVGLRYSNAKASHKESKLQAYESGIMPLQRDFCETLDNHLLPELGDELRELTAFDTREIAALKENQNDIAKRANDGFRANVLRQNEARAAQGVANDPEGDRYAYEILPAPGALLGALTGEPGDETQPGEVEAGTVATTTLNGIQIQAALDVIERLQQGQITDMIAVELLVAVGIERTRAEEMAESAGEADAPATTPEETQGETPGDEAELTPEEQAAAKKAKSAIGAFWRKRAARAKKLDAN